MPSTLQPSHVESSVLRFWGVRGSLPAPGPGTVRYGGNTSCLELRIMGEIIVIDAGSGLRGLGQSLVQEFKKKPLALTLLSTHAHWDHIQGFPFFLPAYRKGTHIRVIGRHPQPENLASIFTRQMDGSHFFPVSLEKLAAKISFEDLDPAGGTRFSIGPTEVSTCATNHPGGCLAYRFDTRKGSLVFLTDHETEGRDEAKIIQFCQGVDVLVADAQYTVEESKSRRGWGHGCAPSVIALALAAQVRSLHLFHHDPSHDDLFIDGMVAAARALVPPTSNLQVTAAAEGQQIHF